MRVENVEMVKCPGCSATLVAGLRFCRMCGYRLGEGIEEYVATQRLDPNAPHIAAQSGATDPFAARATWGQAPLQTPGATSPGRQPYSSALSWANTCRPRRGNWLLWMILVIVLMSAGGAFPLKFHIGGGAGSGGHEHKIPTTSLRAEADAYDAAEGGGASIRGLAGPDTSLERAGLVGGDIIKNFDGMTVGDDDELERLIAATPPGKAVPIIFVHDGETKSTILTTVAREAFHGMDLLERRPGGKGVLDVDFDDDDRVRVPNSNIYGVRLSDIEQNGPAYIAGLKEGDIVIEFDGKPIRTAGDLRYREGAAKPLGVVNIVVVRDGQQMTIPVKMGGEG